MDSTLSKEVRFLKVYSMAATAILSVLLFSAAIPQEANEVFEEIDVERINIVEADGQLRMVISNQARQHPGIINGKEIERSGPRPPGMIFFNHLGDEMGGLIFGQNGRLGHFGLLTFDKVRNDQTMAFRHMEGDNGQYSSGLSLWQRPNIPLDEQLEKLEAIRAMTDPAEQEAARQAMIDRKEFTSNRLFLGKGRDDASLLSLHDIEGKPRIRMQVTADGSAKLEFLDEQGQVVYSIPE
ncbi:MAG: hypothetical protein ACYTG5_06880 [Planctomycetota bacterium]|jgi:hypothetical protein